MQSVLKFKHATLDDQQESQYFRGLRYALPPLPTLFSRWSARGKNWKVDAAVRGILFALSAQSE